MAPETEKPAPKRVSGLHSVDQLGGEINLLETQSTALRKHFAMGYHLAITLAPLVYGVAPR
jgi:hypothetical protein